MAGRAPVIFCRQKCNIVVLMPMVDFKRVSQLNVVEFERSRDRGGADAAQAGMYESHSRSCWPTVMRD